MSNAFAVSAVTSTLKQLLQTALEPELAGGKVTTKPPDKARESNESTNQVNLFLYDVSYNAAWINMNMPNQLKPNETGFPPLPLVLHYLITAYSKDDDAESPVSHTLLGIAMRALHDHPLLGAEEINAALPESDLADQVERVRITPQPMGVEEMSKLWTTFQSNYRISTAYQVSVVLIESDRASKTPLPVLTRGPEDSGIQSRPDLTPVFPTLTAVSAPNKQPGAKLGDTIKLEGFNLNGDTVTAQFRHPRLNDLVTVDSVGGTSTRVEILIPDNSPADWACGVYSISLLIRRAGQQDRETNSLPITVVPEITSPLPLSVDLDSDNAAPVDLTCRPEVLPEQRATLLVSDENARQITSEPHPAQTNALTFIVPDATLSGSDGYFIRLRVDGVDSLLIADYSADVPAFDQNQRVIIS